MAKRIPPLRAGQGVRWTFEVSADVPAKKRPRVKQMASKPQRAKMIVKKARVPKASSVEPARAAETARKAQPPTPVRRATPLQAAVVAAALVVVVAAIAFPRRPAASDVSGSNPQPERLESARDVAPSTPPVAPVPKAAPVAASAVVVAPPRAASESSTRSSVQAVAKRIEGSRKSSAPVAAASAIADAPKQEDSPAKPAASEAPTAPAPVSTESVIPPPVTITGCLEISTDGDTFRLAEVDGADAPKSRSWRTGFLKKRPAPVTLVEPADRLALKTNVGKRVAATGQLASRELKVSSLRVVSSSCN